MQVEDFSQSSLYSAGVPENKREQCTDKDFSQYVYTRLGSPRTKERSVLAKISPMMFILGRGPEIQKLKYTATDLAQCYPDAKRPDQANVL